jgi:hypothetical protein
MDFLFFFSREDVFFSREVAGGGVRLLFHRLYDGSMKALRRLYEGLIQALLKLD